MSFRVLSDLSVLQVSMCSPSLNSACRLWSLIVSFAVTHQRRDVLCISSYSLPVCMKNCVHTYIRVFEGRCAGWITHLRNLYPSKSGLGSVFPLLTFPHCSSGLLSGQNWICRGICSLPGFFTGQGGSFNDFPIWR